MSWNFFAQAAGRDSACLRSNARCDLFITNDDRLSLKVVPGIQFIVSLDRAFA